jgi:hypothetical protein
MKWNGSPASASHSRIVCSISDSDGTNTSVTFDCSFSAIQKAVRVLPVPHAIRSWPRPPDASAAVTSAIARS